MLANALHKRLILLFKGNQLYFRGNTFFNHPFTHFTNAVIFLLPLKTFRRFVSFVAARRGMSLRLGHLIDMHKRRNMKLACDLRCVLIGFEQDRIIPAAYLEELVAALAFRLGARLALEALQNFVDVLLNHLELVRDRNSIAIVIDSNDCRRLEHANGIDRFPEHALRRRSVANTGEGHLVTVLRELGEAFEFLQLTIQHRGIGKPYRARHLRTGR